MFTLFRACHLNANDKQIKLMKRIIITLAAVLLCSVSWAAADWKEGDIVFQTSKSEQSPLIQYATGSRWSHCGIVVKKGGQYYVLEASNVVKLTPIDSWIKRGRHGSVKKRRFLDKEVKVKYAKYLGKPYDLAFKFDNGKYYCSELVWLIYKEQFGIELCKPRKIKSYNLIGIKKQLVRRGMDENQLVVAPCDLL